MSETRYLIQVETPHALYDGVAVCRALGSVEDGWELLGVEDVEEFVLDNSPARRLTVVPEFVLQLFRDAVPDYAEELWEAAEVENREWVAGQPELHPIFQAAVACVRPKDAA